MNLSFSLNTWRTECILLAIYYISFLLLEVTPYSSVAMTFICMVTSAIAIIVVTFYKLKSSVILPFFLLISLYIIGYICNIRTENRTLIQLLYPIVFSGVGFLSFYKKLPYKSYFFLYVVSFVIYIINFLLGGLERGSVLGQGHLPIDIYFLIIYIFMTIEKLNEGKTISVFECLPGLVAAVIDAKRMGVIIWGIIFIINSLIVFKRDEFKARKMFAIYIVIFGVVVYSFSQYTQFLDNLIFRFQNDGVTLQGLADSRQVIWAEYLYKINDLPSLLMGVPVKSVYLLDIYAGNCHNVLVQTHLIYGLLGLLLLIFLVFNITKMFLRKKRIYQLFAFGILIARSMSDYVIMGNFGDGAFVYLLLCSLSDSYYGIEEPRREENCNINHCNYNK